MHTTKSAIHPAYRKTVLSKAQWKQQKTDHEEAVGQLIDDYLDARSRQRKDPIMDFLFEYYAFRPSYLRRWSPGVGVALENGQTYSRYFKEMKSSENGAFLDLRRFPENRISSLQWILEVLQKTAERPPAFGCFGMHEWAMVYKAEHIRHDYLNLRMDMDELTDFVDSRPLVCTHFDAFRFFTEEAKPQNKYELNQDKFQQTEQPGCLHTNMDLYKWAFKMYPWISSKTILRAFKLALETRTVDMKASPYDLRERGHQPIKIETEEGRLEYVKQQRAIFKKSQPIRQQLISEYQQLIQLLE